MSGRISIDNLSDSLKEMIANSGSGLSEEQVLNLINENGLSEEQVLNLINENGLSEERVISLVKDNLTGDLTQLSTTNKTNIVAAINELFQSANNGKELIASAIGEPLNAEDTFSAMSGSINGLLSTFKTNMMKNGVTVNSGDKFKALIDKIAILADNEGGLQYVTGNATANGDVSYDFLSSDGTENGAIYIDLSNLGFTPMFVIVTHNNSPTSMSVYIDKSFGFYFSNYMNVKGKSFTILSYSDGSSGPMWHSDNNNLKIAATATGVHTYHAIGVGKEDTTLRDSLASILQEEGVSVTEEDDMASLISKVDEEFTKDNNTINNLNTDKTNLTNQVNNLNSNIENTRNTLAGLMQEGGYDITGNESINSLLNLLVLSGISVGDIKQIACGYEHTFIVKHDGSLYSCGCDAYGGLGLNGNTNRSDFTQVTTNINNDVKQVACGDYHTVILKNDGSVWSCGYNNKGQLGLGDTTDRYTFTQVTTNINNDVKQISCGNSHTFILKNDGSIWACGYNNYGGLGLGNTTTKTSFTKVTTNINNDVKQIACGGYYTCILKNNGSIWSCGDNDYGQLGLNDTTDRKTFTKVTTNINNDVKQIACGYQHTFIVKTNGSLWCCGNNEHSQLGLNSTSSYKTSFTQVTENINNDVKQVICGWYHTFILKTNISTWCCGYNIHGQIGLGDTTDRYIFTTIPRGV